jgi:hypothetical protein
MSASHVPWEPVVALALKIAAKFGLIPGAAAGMGVRKLYQKRRQRKAMESWPAVEARIGGGTVRSEGYRTQWAEVTYTYFIDEYRLGRYVRKFKTEAAAEDFVAQIKDIKIQARYNPANPDESVILEHDIEMRVLSVPQIG